MPTFSAGRQTGPWLKLASVDHLAIVELAAAYKKFARSYYRKNGASTRHDRGA